MNIRRLASLSTAIIILFVSINLSTIGYSETNADYKCYSVDSRGLLVEIEASAFAWPEENVNITVRAEATHADVYIYYINVNISSLEENRSETLLGSATFFEDVHLERGEFEVTSYKKLVPTNSLPGSLYGEVEYRWSIEGDESTFDKLEAFPATYIQNKPYEELRQNYEALNSFLNDLQSNYTSLEANYTDLQKEYQQLADNRTAQNNSTGLMYLFIITTGIFIVTTILLLAKRPKTTTW